MAILSMALALPATVANAKTLADKSWDVWELSLGANDEDELLAKGLTQEEAEKIANELCQRDPATDSGKVYVAVPTRVDEMRVPNSKKLRRLLQPKLFDRLREYKKEVERAYARAKQAKQELMGRTQSLGEDEFNKVNAQIDEYNKQREGFRAKYGSYPPPMPALARLRPGDVNMRTSPSPAYSRPQSSNADPNPRLVMVETPKPAPKGVAMRIGIDRGSYRRVEAPRTLVASIRAASE
jgi:hypothetical protein